MASPRRSTLLLFVLLAASALIVSGSGGGEEFRWAASSSRRSCEGTVGECNVGDDDGGDGMFDASAAHRRALATITGYISYDALLSDSVPCSLRGASYYNCQPGADANPYSRGCSVITLCRSLR